MVLLYAVPLSLPAVAGRGKALLVHSQWHDICRKTFGLAFGDNGPAIVDTKKRKAVFNNVANILKIDSQAFPNGPDYLSIWN